MEPHTVFNALTLAVSPVILISACGLLLLSMTNRLGRAIDRARALVRESTNKQLQIEIISRRAKWIRSAILFVTISIVLIALLVLALFFELLLPFDLRLLVASLFILGVISLIISLGYFLADIFGSLRAMEDELHGISKD